MGRISKKLKSKAQAMLQRLNRSSIVATSTPSLASTAQASTSGGLSRGSGVTQELVLASATADTIDTTPTPALVFSSTPASTPPLAADGVPPRSPPLPEADARATLPDIAGESVNTTVAYHSPTSALILSANAVVSMLHSPLRVNSGAAQSDIKITPTLWEQALKRLKPEDLVGIDLRKDNKVDLLCEFIRETKEKKDECEEKRWGYENDDGEKVFYADILLTQLKKYVAIGDIALQHHPDIVALAWAGFRLILQVATADMENLRLIFESLGYLVHVLSRCDIYEKLYAGRELKASELLNASLVNLYVSILQYLCYARRELGADSTIRLLESIFSDLGQLFKKVQECEKDVGNDADTAEKEAAGRESLAQEGRTEELRKLLSEIQEPLDKIGHAVGKIHTYVEKQKRLEILMWLSDVPVRDHHSFLRVGRHKDTGHWLLHNEKFLQWRNSSSKPILWLRGDAGSGKTVLVSKVIDELPPQLDKQQALAYFYCNYREEARRDPASILRTLIKQLCLMVPEGQLPAPVLSIYQEREDNGHTSGPLSLDECKNLIVDLSEGFLQTTIIIDALDECNRDTRGQLFCILQQIVASTNHVRIFVASRNDGDICNTLGSFSNHYISAADNTKDIDIYIMSQIEHRFNEGQLPKGGDSVTLKEDIISALSRGANGMFIWVHFQILAICQEKTPGNVRRALSRLPKDLNETYTRILKIVNSQSSDTTRTAKTVLNWLLYAKELNSPEIINEFLSVKPGESTLDPDTWTQPDILDICKNLVVYDKELNVLRFAHFSVQEFLILQAEFSQEKEVQTLAAEVCLTVLTHHYSETHSPTPALLKYAIQNWGNLVGLSGAGSSTLEGLITNFINPSLDCYKAWVSGYRQKDIRTGCSSALFDVVHNHKLFGRLESLLDRGLFSHCNDHCMETLLCLSAIEGRSDFVQLLVRQQGVDINYKRNGNMTPLHSAARGGYQEVVQILLEQKEVDLNLRSRNGYTPLVWAVGRSRKEVVQILLGRDVELNTRDDYFCLTPVLVAVWYGREEMLQVVQMLLEKGGGGLGGVQEMLSLAAIRGRMDMVQMLLGMDGVGSKCIQEALSLAAMYGEDETVRVFLENGGVDLEGVQEELSLAAECGTEKVAQMLLEKGGVGPECVQEALSLAAMYGKETAVQMLLEKGGVSLEGVQEALLLAIGCGEETVVQMLSENGGVDVEVVLEALSLTPKCGLEKVVQMLLEKDRAGFKGVGKALSLAARKGDEDLTRMLLEKDGVDLGDVQKAVSWAAMYGQEKVVQMLLEKGEVNLEGAQRALWMAAIWGHAKVVHMLLEKGGVGLEGVLKALSLASKNAGVDLEGVLKVTALLKKHALAIDSKGESGLLA